MSAVDIQVCLSDSVKANWVSYGDVGLVEACKSHAKTLFPMVSHEDQPPVTFSVRNACHPDQVWSVTLKPKADFEVLARNGS